MNGPCYVYAIVRRRAALPTSDAGISAAGLVTVPSQELAAVAGPMPHDGASVTVEAVLRHEAIVEAVRRHVPALPVRFGTVFPDAASVASALAERQASLVADLDRVGDKVEMSLTALWAVPPAGVRGDRSRADEDASPSRGAGARYLRARAAELQREDALKERARGVARELELALAGWVLERRELLLPTPRIAVRAAYLLEPAGAGAFHEAVAAMRDARSDVRLLLSGPWPPYSFVDGADGRRGRDRGGGVEALAARLTDAMHVGPG